MRTMTLLSVVAGSAALTTQHGRIMSEPPILGYHPASSVVQHNRIDLDQKALEASFGTCAATAATTCDKMSGAKAVYEKGGFSSPQGVCTIDSSSNGGKVKTAFAKKAVLKYKKSGGTDVSSKASAEGKVGGTTISFYYSVSKDRTMGANDCVVGGVPSTTAGYQAAGNCLGANAEITIGSDTYKCSAVANTKASRTLQGFSTKAKKLMWDPTMGSCPAEVTTKSYKNGCPYTSFKPYWDYYCSTTASSCNADGGYADDIIQAAIASGKTTLTNGNVDFAQASGVQLKEVIKKGTAYMNAWMYAIREFEDAIDDCTGSALTKNDMSSGSVHAWDEGVAFYTGSIMETGHLSGAGPSGASANYDVLELNSPGIGKLAYTLGNKRCRNFKTCGKNGGENVGQSHQNYMLTDLFNEGQVDFRTGTCGPVVPVKNKIVQWMTVPLVQGTLRYTYETGVAAGSLKGRAEGAIFALAVLPQLHACSAAAAKTVHDNVVATIASGAQDFNAVKAAFEGCYSKMFPDIAKPCAAIGTYGGSAGTQDLTAKANTAACTDPSTSDDSGLSSGALVGIIIAAVVAVLLLLVLIFVLCKEKAGKPVFAPTAVPAQGSKA